MTDLAFQEWVSDQGKDILRFCRMTTGSLSEGDELYQDTMMTLLEKQETLDTEQNIKSYALSVVLFLWRNKRKKFAWRKRIVPSESYEKHLESGMDVMGSEERGNDPEKEVLKKERIREVRDVVSGLPEKYRIVLYLYYSADLKIKEIAACLHMPESTVKSRMRKAKMMVKRELEVLGYDR